MTDSVYALKPNFSNKEGYLAWRNTWKLVYRHISSDIRRRKNDLKVAQRVGGDTAKLQKSLMLQRADARKLMTLLEEAKLLRDRLFAMRSQMAEFRASLPITISARLADFSFNKGHIQFPEILPRWMVKANGQTMYIDHLDSQIGFSTRELDEGSTLGMIRFRNVSITIDVDGIAHLTERVKMKAVA